MNYSASHDDHAAVWMFTTPTKDVPSCMACLVLILEDEEKICVQKKPALSELNNLLQQSAEVVTLLKENINISLHTIVILIELLRYDDNLFVSQVLDVCIKLIRKLESEELVRFVFEALQSQVETTTDKMFLLPVYLFLGRLIQNFPTLALVLVDDYGTLLEVICQALSFPDEEIQSAVVYIFVHMLEGDWLTFLPSHVYQQILQEVICQLCAAKSQGLIINTLGLLKKLVQRDEAVKKLMILNIDGVTLLSVLKKLLVSKNDVYQLSSVHILSNVLSCPGSCQYTDRVLQSDIIEFLFESLHTRNTTQIGNIYRCIEYLCQLEKFYTRCHSVYGIDSILRSLEILSEMKNYVLIEEGLGILAAILERQPSSIPLFINSKSVECCLSIITNGLKQYHPRVFSTSLQALLAVIRKDHLLLPVPFKEIETAMVLAGDKMWQNSQNSIQGSGTMPKSTSKGEKYNSTETFCGIHHAAVKLLKACIDDPLACASSFMAPSNTQNSTVASFQSFLLYSSSQNCIPLVMRTVDENQEISGQLMDLLCQLYHIDPVSMSNIIFKYSVSGGLSFVLNVKANFSMNTSLTDIADSCLIIMCKVLHQADNKDIHQFPIWQETVLKEVRYKLEDLPKILSRVMMNEDTKDIYLFLLYHTAKHGNMLLTGTQLAQILDMVTNEMRRPCEWSPPTMKHYIFLAAVSQVSNDVGVSYSEKQAELLCDVLGGSMATELWYTHHPALLQWTFIDKHIYRLCHDRVLEAYLSHIIREYPDNLIASPDLVLVIELCQKRTFLDSLVGLLVTAAVEIRQTAEQVIQIYIDQITSDEERLQATTYLRAKASEVTNDLFLNELVQSQENRLLGVMSVLLKTYKIQQESTESGIQPADIKLIYHVVKFLASEMTLSPALQVQCIQYLLEVIRNYDEISKRRVLSMMLQNQRMLVRFEVQLMDESTDLVSVTVNLLTNLLVYCNTLPDCKCSRPISLDVLPVSILIQIDNPHLITSYLALFTVLLDVKFCTPLLTLKHTGRFPLDPRCPFMSSDFQELYIYIQQCLFQEHGTVQGNAATCLRALISYLNEFAPDLERVIINHPWNTIMLEVILQTEQGNHGNSRHHVMILVDIFLTAGHTFGENQDLLVLLLEYLQDVLRDDQTSAWMFQTILSKAQLIVPQPLIEKYQDIFQQNLTNSSQQT